MIVRLAILLSLLMSSTVWAQSSVVDSVHNLSASGPGDFISQTEDQVCVFCHTPHRPEKGPGLWNRRVSTAVTPGTSPSTIEGRGNSSALCLSCHDGTIALGEMLAPPRGKGGLSGGDMRGAFLSGRSNFGTNLSNHHPVGIDYNRASQGLDSGLAHSAMVDLPLNGGELHCAGCHDPHSPEFEPFLNKPSLNGELCTSCHTLSGNNWDWASSAHSTSDRVPSTGDPWAERKEAWKGGTVAENSCENCHSTHNSVTQTGLLKDIEERTCLRCHDGSVSKSNIQAATQQFYRHPVERPAGDEGTMGFSGRSGRESTHVECEDCHNPHASKADLPMISFNPSSPSDPNHMQAPLANGVIAGVPGVDVYGQFKEEIDFEYEACFGCHGVIGRSACYNRRCSTAEDFRMNRQDEVYNIREKLDASNSRLVSYHPVTSNNPANNLEVPSLRRDIPLNRHDSMIYCGDCHGDDDSPASGGTGPSGQHGSRYEAMLVLNYSFSPDQPIGSRSADLCFKCHDRGNLFSDESFLHSTHVLRENKTCINCHDPHGSAVSPHLINFLTSFSNASGPLEITGSGGDIEPEYIDTGMFSGSCSLNCHGVEHDDWSYGPFSNSQFLIRKDP